MNCEITFGRLIKNARLYQSMSQIELARRLTVRTEKMEVSVNSAE